jgi:hypothetical protein
MKSFKALFVLFAAIAVLVFGAAFFTSASFAADVDERPNQFWEDGFEQTRAELVKLMGKPVKVDLMESEEGFQASPVAQYQTYCYGSGDELNFYFIVGFASAADMKANKHNAEFLYCVSATSPRYPLEGFSAGQTASQLVKSKGEPGEQTGETVVYETEEDESSSRFYAKLEDGKITQITVSRSW